MSLSMLYQEVVEAPRGDLSRVCQMPSRHNVSSLCQEFVEFLLGDLLSLSRLYFVESPLGGLSRRWQMSEGRRRSRNCSGQRQKTISRDLFVSNYDNNDLRSEDMHECGSRILLARGGEAQEEGQVKGERMALVHSRGDEQYREGHAGAFGAVGVAGKNSKVHDKLVFFVGRRYTGEGCGRPPVSDKSK